MTTPGGSIGAPCQRQNYPRQDQLTHTHYNLPLPQISWFECPISPLGGPGHRARLSARHTIQCEPPRSINPAGPHRRAGNDRRLPLHQDMALCPIRSNVRQPIRICNFSLCGVNGYSRAKPSLAASASAIRRLLDPQWERCWLAYQIAFGNKPKRGCCATKKTGWPDRLFGAVLLATVLRLGNSFGSGFLASGVCSSGVCVCT